MIKKITIGENVYKLDIPDFDDDIDIESILKIDYSNLIGEIITFPVILNRFGCMLAEMESNVSEGKLNLEVFEAKLKEKYRSSLSEQKGGKFPTVDELNSAVSVDSGYQAMKKRFINSQKNRDYIQSVFWSARDKSSKLDKLSLTIQSGDVEEHLIEGKINNIVISKKGNVIK